MTRFLHARKLLATTMAVALAATGALVTAGSVAAQSPDLNGAIEDLTSPVGIAINSSGERFIAQTSTDTVVVYAPGSDVTPSRTLSGMAGYAWAIAFDSTDAAYVTCPNAGVVYVFNSGSTTPDRTITDIDRDPDSPQDDPDPTTDPFPNTLGIAIDSADNVFLANSTNEDESVYVVDAGQSTPNDTKRITGLQNPTSLAVDSNDNLYIGSIGVEAGNNPADTVKVVARGSTSIDESRTINGLANVYGIAFGLNNRLYVANSTTIRVYDATTHAVQPSKEMTGLRQTMGIAVVPGDLVDQVGGTLYATQFLSGSVKRFSPGPLVEANPAVATLADTLVGGAATQIVSVTNSGSSELQLAPVPVSLTGAVGQYTILGNTCGDALLTPGGSDSCTFTIRFAPTSRGTKSMVIAIASNSPDSPYTLPVTGQAISPVATTTPTAWNFESTLVSGGSDDKRFTITNDGDAPLVFPASSVDLTGLNADQYSLSETCSGSSVLPNRSCSATVTFDPSSPGSKVANLHIAPLAPETSHSYALTGTGTSPGFLPSTSTLSFGPVTTGSSSAESIATVSNDGTAALHFPTNAVTISGDHRAQFHLTTDTCSQQALAPSATCSVGVIFSPAATGSYSASLDFANDAPGNPQSVAMAGSGVQPTPSATPMPSTKTYPVHTVGVTAPASQQFIVTNNGTSMLEVDADGISVVGANATDFVVIDDTCSGAHVPVGSTCAVTVRFEPQTGGTKSAMLRIASNEPGAPRNVALAGSAITTASAPTVVVGTPGNGYIDITWGTVATTGNSPITGYQVQLATAPSGPFTTAIGCAVNATLTVHACRASNVTNGRYHYARVAAINIAGIGEPQTSAAVLPRAVAQTLLRCPIPRRARKVGRTVVIPGACRTTAGQIIRVSARKAGGARVVRAGSRWFVIMSKRRGVATFVISAPASGIYLPMVQRITFRN